MKLINYKKNILIKNANFPDFDKWKFVKKNLLIENGIIKDILSLNKKIENIDNVIDAEGLITSSGFIDSHSHSDLLAFENLKNNPKLNQGVLYEIVGNCGLSVVPVTVKNRKQWKNLYTSIWGFDKVDWNWTDTKSYLDIVNKKLNIFTLIGYSTVRYLVKGLNPEPLTVKELNKVEQIIEEELLKGAIGVSLGIGYAPNIFAQKNEYELISKLLKKHNKILTTHIRDEGNRVVSSIREIISFIKKHPCKLHISHLKTYGKRNWYKNKKVLSLIDDLNKNYDITFDSYPYDVGSTTLTSVLPPNYLKFSKKELFQKLKNKKEQLKIYDAIKYGIKGWENYGKTSGFENIYPIGLISKKYKKYNGKNLIEISKKLNNKVIEIICDIIIKEDSKASMFLKAMSEKNIVQMLKHNKQMIGSDGLFSLNPHPRTYGTFPRVIGKYVREEKQLSLMEALYKMTKFPSDRFGLGKIGEIKKGYKANLVIFDYNKIKDTATYENPKNYSEGLEYIFHIN